MQIEKTFKREDGAKVRVILDVSIDFMDTYRNITVMICNPSKRTFIDVHNSDDYSWRALNTEDRKKAILDKQLQYVSEEEINVMCRDFTEQLYAKIAL